MPNRRKGPLAERAYTMADIGLSAFSLFFMGSPSFLAHQRNLAEGQGRSNCQCGAAHQGLVAAGAATAVGAGGTMATTGAAAALTGGATGMPLTILQAALT